MKTISFDQSKFVRTSVWAMYNIFDKIEVRFEALVEDMEPDFDPSIMPAFKRKLKNDQQYQAEGVSHNWFCAKVTVYHKGFESESYLGGCSYKSYDEFVRLKDDYFTDMVRECIDGINDQIKEKNEEIQKHWESRKVCA